MSIEPKKEPTKLLQRAVLVILVTATYVAALFLPAVEIEVRPDDPTLESVPLELAGYQTIGVVGEWQAVFPQIANGALLIGMILILTGKCRPALYLSIVGVCMAASAPLAYGIYLDDLRIGYYVWLACMVLLVIVCALSKRPRQPIAKATAMDAAPRL